MNNQHPPIKKLPALVLLFLVLVSVMPVAAQNCGGPVSVIAPYYSYEAHTKFGVGLEAGIQGVDSRTGLYVGFSYQQLTTNYQKRDTSGFNYRSSFYLKGTLRINDHESAGSIFLVASPQLSLQSGYDVLTGLKFMYPFFGKTGMGIEPLYSLKQKDVRVNFIVAF